MFILKNLTVLSIGDSVTTGKSFTATKWLHYPSSFPPTLRLCNVFKFEY